MDNKNKIKISKESRENMIAAIKKYFLNDREEDLGDLASDLILEFIIEELAFEFYNQGVQDSYKYMGRKIEDLLALQKYRK